MSQRPQLFGKTLFVDLMMGTLVVVTGLLMMSNMEERAKTKKAIEDANAHTEGVYAVSMTWDEKSDDDVDLYVRDPSGAICYFQAKQHPLMNLERDDVGYAAETVMLPDGSYKSVFRNDERVVLRGTMPGEYVVNVHMFRKRDPKPATVVITLTKLKGDDTVVIKKVRILPEDGDEATAFRFTLSESGTVTGTNELDVKFVAETPYRRGSQ
ncbi:MAG: hypothetical protein RLZZ324_843 [Candidatus Parcubacteria bacterium]|jgi:hypothetical protein